MAIARMGLGVLAALFTGMSASAASIKVGVDQARTLRLGEPATTLVVGNAAIADVFTPDGVTLILTGKSFGATNLLALDEDGRTIYSAMLTVGAGGASSDVVLRRGVNRHTLSCTPVCAPSPIIGDDPASFDLIFGQRTTATGQNSGGGS